MAAPQTLFPLIAPLRASKPSMTLAINEAVKQKWAQQEKVYHLGFGESRWPICKELTDSLHSFCASKSYGPSAGLWELREAVAKDTAERLGLPEIDPRRVIIGPGSKGLLFILQASLNADLILPTPSWVSYSPQAELLGRKVYRVPANPEDGYDLKIENVEAIFKALDPAAPKPLMVINSPNNPTGRMLSPEFLQELAKLCREHGIAVMSDEIYSRVTHEYDEGEQSPVHHSIAKWYPEGTVIFSGLSKHLSLGGWRLGTAIVPGTEEGYQLSKALETYCSELWSSAATPLQQAAVLAYQDTESKSIQTWVEQCTKMHSVRTQEFWRILNQELGIQVPRPEGSFYLFPNFNQWREQLARRNVHTSQDLAQHLLERYNVATLPGAAFGTPPEDLSLRLATSYLDCQTDEDADRLFQSFDPADSQGWLEREHKQLPEAAEIFRTFVRELQQEA